MTAFELIAKLTADTSGFDSAMSKAEKSGKSLKGSLENTFGKIKKVAAGALSVAAIKKGIDTVVNFANEVSQAGDRIDKQSQVLGLSRKAFQEWDYILGQNGASIDSMSVSMKTLNNLILDAAKGGKESKSAFAQLGVGIHEIEKLKPEEQFEAVVRAFQRMPAGAEKSALAVKIFGRQGMELLPLLNQSETSIDELRARAEELGLIMSDDAVDAAVVYGDSLDDLQRTFNAFKYSIGAKILPVLTSGIQKITTYAGKLRKAYDEKGLAGVWDTLVTSFKSIKWPTQEEIIGKIKEMWEGVKTAAKNVLKLVFGESANGDIKWPSPKEIETKVKDGLTSMWKGVQNLATSILKLVFGEDENGGIDFPSSEVIWEKIKGGLGALWAGIKGLAKGVLTLVFGESEDGGIAFPSSDQVWEKIKGTFESWWSGLKSLMEAQLKYVLGVPELPDAHTTGQLLKEKLAGWWETIKGVVKSVFSWFLPNPEMEDADGTGMQGAIQTWWDDKVKPALKGLLNFVLGLFDLPDVDAMKQKVIDWWESVKTAVGNLFVDIVPRILGISGGNSEYEGWESEQGAGGPPGSDTWYVGEGSHAKGLNYVPYNNYHALLHRGEQVLTASQARRRGSGGTDVAALLNGLTGAVREGISGAQLNSYMDSTKVTSKTNNVTGRKLISRRFAPA